MMLISMLKKPDRCLWRLFGAFNEHTEGKCYSVREMEDLLTEAGFREVKYQTTVVDRSFMTARKA
jgi:hypothetical protein